MTWRNDACKYFILALVKAKLFGRKVKLTSGRRIKRAFEQASQLGYTRVYKTFVSGNKPDSFLAPFQFMFFNGDAGIDFHKNH